MVRPPACSRIVRSCPGSKIGSPPSVSRKITSGFSRRAAKRPRLCSV